MCSLCMDELYHIVVVNVNVSSIKLMHMINFLDTFSMGLTFGIRAGRFRLCHGLLNFN